MRLRRGTTLLELIVSLAMLGVVGALVADSVVRHTRTSLVTRHRLAARSQLHEALTPVAIDVASISAAAGDVTPGALRDTAFDARIAIARGIACDSATPGTVHVVLRVMRHGGSVGAGDSLEVFAAGRWRGSLVSDAREVGAPSACGSLTSAAVLRVSIADTMSVAGRSPVVFTRRVRYNLYRGGDGDTWLGLREWIGERRAFGGVQPVAGPFDRRRSRFTYFDLLGAELPSGAVDPQSVARVALTLRAPPMDVTADTAGVPRASLVAALRNRR